MTRIIHWLVLHCFFHSTASVCRQSLIYGRKMNIVSWCTVCLMFGWYTYGIRPAELNPLTFDISNYFTKFEVGTNIFCSPGP